MGQVTAKLKEYWGKLKEWLKKVPKKFFVLAAIVLALIVGVIVFVQLSQPYSVLFTGLNSEEAAAIVSYLDTQGAKDYRVENNDTILVPKSQENNLKAKLLMEGYPKNGFSYSTYYDHVGALSTESERNTAYLLTLQDRMGAVIRCFDGVKEAAVTITPGEDKSYVLDPSGKIETTASVFVTMNSGQLLTDQQAEAIRTLVAHAVQGLQISQVSITDGYGNSYSTINGNENAEDASTLKLLLEQKYNNLIRTNIMQVLVPLFGDENVKVGVACNVDVNKTIRDDKDVIVPDNSVVDSEGIKGIIGSKVYDNYIVREGDANPGGTVGTTTNADLPTYVEEGRGDNGTGTGTKTSGQIDYNNSEHQTHIERVAGYLSDCMVSVSINSATTTPLSAARMKELTSHVARAAGITEDMAADKVSLFASPFYKPNTVGDDLNTGFFGFKSPYMWAICIAAAATALILFIVLLLLLFGRKKRRRRKKIEVYRQPEASIDLTLPPEQPEQPAGADIMTLQSDKNMQLRKDIRKFADDNPEIAAQMVRNLLRGGESDA